MPEQEEEEVTTVVVVLNAFWQHAKKWYRKNGQPTSELDDLKRVIKEVKRLYADLAVADFSPLKFKAVRQQWIDRGLARSTVNKNAGRVKHIFKWAVSEELAPPSVAHALASVEGLRKGRCDCPEPSPVPPVEIARVEQTLLHVTPVLADMIRFQMLTGARPGEVCTLTPSAVNRSHEVWEYYVDGHKTEHHGRSRTVMIGPKAQELLRPYLDRSPDIVCFSMSESKEQRLAARHTHRKTPLSCGNRRGKRSNADRKGTRKTRKPRYEFDSKTYGRAIRDACDRAFPPTQPLACREGESNRARLHRLTEEQLEELKAWQKDHRWSPNQLRHTRATEIRMKHGLEAAQVILGHAKADVTQIYAERDKQKAREIMAVEG
jgi:integrase